MDMKFVLPASYNALCDILIQVAAARHEYVRLSEVYPDVEHAEKDCLFQEQSALIRAIAIIAGNGYQSTEYRIAFYEIVDAIDAGKPAGEIALTLINQYGK